MKIILLGPPGSGKGTQAELLCKEFSIGHISTGEILRQAILKNTTLGFQAKQAIDAGKLVADDLISNLVAEEITKSSCANGFLLDGFPRNLIQTKSLEQSGVVIDFIIYLNVADQIIVERLSGRLYHPGSGRIYHVKHNQPKHSNVDDITGEPLITRLDDQEQIISQRLLVYHQSTEQMIEWYQTREPEKFIEIDASRKKAEIFKEIIDFVRRGSAGKKRN